MPPKDLDLLPLPTTKKVTITRDIKSGQDIILVDLEPGASFETISTHELEASESCRSAYRKFVAPNVSRGPPDQSSNDDQSFSYTPDIESPASTGTNTPVDNQASAPLGIQASPSIRGTKRKASVSNGEDDSPLKLRKRRPRTQATVPPSTRVLRNSS